MSFDANRATMEAELARAHRAIVHAKAAADRMNDAGAYLDLQQIEVEIVRVSEGSLKGKSRRGQLRGRAPAIGDPLGPA